MTKFIKKANSLLLFALSSLLILMYGCSGGRLILKHYTRPQFDISNVKKIAVLPLENFTSDKYADEKISRTVIIELLSRGIDVIEPGEVTRILRELKVRSLGSITTSDIRRIGKVLGVEAVMKGSVVTFGISRGISVSYPEISIRLMLLEATSGKIVWSVWHTAGGAGFWTRHFGAEGLTVDETAGEVVKVAVDTLF